MKKNCISFWFLKPDVNFPRLLLPMKVLVIFLFCGTLNAWAVPSYDINIGSYTNLTNSSFEDPLVHSVNPEQQKSISGTVTDAASREPMPGVNVLIKGTTLGAITDVNGSFTIFRIVKAV